MQDRDVGNGWVGWAIAHSLLYFTLIEKGYFPIPFCSQSRLLLVLPTQFEAASYPPAGQDKILWGS